MSMIPEDIAQTARRVTDGVDGWIGSIVGMEIVARAILAERKRCADVARHLSGWGYPPAPALADHIANIIESGQ